MGEPRRTRSGDRAAFLLSFSSFFVFPAIPIGNTTGLAIPSVLAPLLTFVWLGRIAKRDWAPYAWMTVPLALSGCYVLLTGSVVAADVVPKVFGLLSVTFFIVIPTGYLLRSGYGEPFVLGAAYAVLVHAAIGAYQVFAFDNSEFPFAEVMSTNPGMAMSPDTIDKYVEFVKRPFGLFAEPSAMAACVGPWLVLMSIVLFTPSLQQQFRRHRTVLMAALASGLAFVAVSRSGQAVPIVAASTACVVGPVFTAGRRPLSRWAALGLGAAMVCGTAVWLLSSAASRFDLSQNESWQLRLSALEAASQYLGTTSLFGMGPGQSVSQIRSSGLGRFAPGNVTAVWSVTLTYAMETGLVGLAAMAMLGRSIGRAVWRSRARAAGLAFALVWLIGVLVGTSYAQQPALWTAMATLLSWRSMTGDYEAETP